MIDRLKPGLLLLSRVSHIHIRPYDCIYSLTSLISSLRDYFIARLVVKPCRPISSNVFLILNVFIRDYNGILTTFDPSDQNENKFYDDIRKITHCID